MLSIILAFFCVYLHVIFIETTPLSLCSSSFADVIVFCFYLLCNFIMAVGLTD